MNFIISSAMNTAAQDAAATVFVLKITAIQKICSSEHYNGYYHH